MSHFVVNRDLCRKDGICARVCPVHIILAAPDGYPVMHHHHESLCIGCGQCMAFCPTGACAAPGLDPAQCRPLRRDLQPAPEQVEELIFARRSVRAFKEAPLPRDLLLRLLDATRFAPSAKNAQALRWIVLESRPQTHHLAELVIDWMRRLPGEDAAMAKACHAEGLARAWDRGTDVITRDAPQVAVAVAAADWSWGLSDAAIAAAYLELAAQAHGVGCCWGGYVCLALRHPTGGDVRAFLGIAEREAACAVQLMGRPLFKSYARPQRKPLDLTWL